MFMVSETDAALVRAAYEFGGEFDAMLALRRMAPGLSVEQARECARTIAGWTPLALPVPKIRRRDDK